MTVAFAAFTLTSPNAQAAAPFFIGHAFKKGEVPSNYYVAPDLANVVVVPLKTWNDGSLKHAAIIGRAALAAATPLQVNLLKTLTAPSAGTLLTAASIATAAPTATVQCGSIGTVSLASLLASPQRTHISTKEMVECHYTSAVGADPKLWVNFHVRLFVDGRMFVRAIVGNDYVESGTSLVTKNYIPTITIGGVVAWDNGGASYTHSGRARYDITAWIGTNPLVTPKHDTTYLNKTKLVPNIWKTGPSGGAISAFSSTVYTPGSHLSYTDSMGAAGYQAQIGLLPLWDALYLSSQGNATMYNAVVEHARAINSYGIVYVDQSTRNPFKITSYPTWSASGAGGAGGDVGSTVGSGGATLSWEYAHFPSAGYLAYILTADYYYLESCVMNAGAVYMNESSGHGSGVNRYLNGQNRARAWAFRSISQAAAMVPDGNTVMGDYATWLATMMTTRATAVASNTAMAKLIGYDTLFNSRLYSDASLAPDGQLCAGTAPWEHHFTTMALGMAGDIEPVAVMTNLLAYRDYLLAAPVWITGGLTTAEYNFGYAGAYTVNIRIGAPVGGAFDAVQANDLIPPDLGAIYTDTYSTAPGSLLYNPGTSVLTGTSGGLPSDATGYWANMLPALAYAVDGGKTGAAASFARLTGASNFSAQNTAGYENIPQFGIMPRSYSQPAAVFTPVGSNGDPEPGAQASGPTTRVDSGNWPSSGVTLVGPRGHGILAEDISDTLGDYRAIVYNDLSLPGDIGHEIFMQVVTLPAGTLTLYPDDNSATYSGASGTLTYRLWDNAADKGTGIKTFTLGSTVLVGAASSQANASGTGAIGQTRIIAGAASGQANAASAAAITQVQVLAGAACSQPNATSVGALDNVVHFLVGAPGSQANATATGAISQNHQLVGAASLQSNSASTGAVGSAVILIGDPSGQANECLAASIVVSHVLMGTASLQENFSLASALTGSHSLFGSSSDQINLSPSFSMQGRISIHKAPASRTFRFKPASEQIPGSW